jgi:hypothetical protein
MDAEELLDWIRALDTYFDYEDVEEDKKVKHVVMRLKGHATLWWDDVTPYFPQFVKITGLAKNYGKLINVNM